MKKRMWWGGAAVLVIAYLLISWRIGFAIEKQIDAQLEQATSRTPYVEVRKNIFRRGWFKSQQDLTFELFGNLQGAANPFSAPLQVKVHNVIWHGPICGFTCLGLARVRTHLSFGAPLQGYLASAFGTAEPLRIESRMGFNGGGAGTISSPAIKDVVLANGARLSWGGIDVASEFGAGYNSYSVQGTAPKFAFATSDGTRLEFDDIDLKARAERALRTLFQGRSSLAVGRVSFSAAKTGGAVFNKITGDYAAVAKDGYMSMNYQTSIGPITVSSVAFSGAHFDFALNHMEMDSLEQLSAAMQKVNQNMSLPPAQRGVQLLAAMKQPGLTFLSHDPQFALSRFSVATGNGEALLSGTVSTSGILESDFGSGADPKAMLQKLNADLEVSIDDGFLNGVPGGAQAMTQLQAFVAQGLATHANGKFHTKIAFHQGVTTFDGKNLPQPAAPAAVPPARH